MAGFPTMHKHWLDPEYLKKLAAGEVIQVDEVKRAGQIKMLKACLVFTETGAWAIGSCYPYCAWDLVEMGLIAPGKEITMSGLAALFLLSEGSDPLTATTPVVAFSVPNDGSF